MRVDGVCPGSEGGEGPGKVGLVRGADEDVVDGSRGLVGCQTIKQAVRNVPFCQCRCGNVFTGGICIDGFVKLDFVNELKSIAWVLAYGLSVRWAMRPGR